MKRLKRLRISMDLLASVALVFSLLSAEWTSALFIALMMAAARVLQWITTRQMERSLRGLLKLRPNLTRRLRAGQLESIPLKELAVGDMVVVDLGERIPADATIVEGHLAVDESSLTGESLPVEKGAGARVFSSTIVVSGSAKLKVEKLGPDTTLEKIIALVESASEHKSRLQTIGERFGKIYLLSIFLAAPLIFYFTHNLSLVLAVVLVVCADDVVVAVPLAYLAATRTAARRGVIVKSSQYLEALGQVETMVFDKTGTLTTGHLRVVEVVVPSAGTKVVLLSAATALAEQSHHPIARAILAYAEAEKVPPLLASEVSELGGLGLTGRGGGQEIILARKDFLTARGIKVDAEVQTAAERLEKAGHSLSYVAVAGKLLGLIALKDEVRPGLKTTMEHLHRLGIKRTVMLTGDNELVANLVAREIGLREVHARLRPEQKVNYLQGYLHSSRAVAMVGDGVNDAASLRLATVGIAMGVGGYDAAIESADIVLMRDNLGKIAETIELAHFVRRLARQDFLIWGLSNVVGLTLVFSGLIGPAGAAAYNFITDFFPLFNSLRATKGPRSRLQ